MRAFQYYMKTEVLFGADMTDRTADLVQKHGGSRVLVVYGGGSAVKSGLLDRICGQLQAAGIVYDTFGGVQPNPRLSHARKGVEKSLSMGADLILAVGGGSVIDTAKAIAHGTANPDVDIWDFWMKRAVVQKSLPVGVVLTIPAAGSETSDSAVLTNEETCSKRGLSTDYNRPAFAVLDPKLAATLSRYQVACGVTDIMMHTLDRYFNPAPDNEISDALAEALLRVVIDNGFDAMLEPDHPQYMSEIMWCGSLSHNGLTGCGNDGGDFASHVMEHEMGAMYDVAHGAGLAAIWGSWARYVYKDCLHRFVRFATNVMGVEAVGTDEAIALKGIEALEAFYRELNMPTNFRELGVEAKDEELREMARKAMEFVGGAQGSAKVLHEEDMYEIFKMAL